MTASGTAKHRHKVVEVVAPTLEEGLKAGASALGVSPAEAEAEVLEQKSGFMGLGGSRLRIRVTKRHDAGAVEPTPPTAVDGKFLIGCRDGVFQLLVTPPQASGAAVTQEQVKSALEELPLPEGVEDVWRMEVASPTGIPVVLLPGALRMVTDSASVARHAKAPAEAASAARPRCHHPNPAVYSASHPYRQTYT